MKRKTPSSENFTLYKRNRDEFLRRFLRIRRESIIRLLKIKKSNLWTATGESARKNANAIFSANEVLRSAFWDARGIKIIDYFEKDEIVNGEYFTHICWIV